MILAIDPGNIESAYVLLDKELKPLEFGKFINENVKAEIRRLTKEYYTVNNAVTVVIEMIASYGMSVGQSVFETCLWVGRFSEVAESNGSLVKYIYRKDEKMNLCHSMKANDATIKQALVDRFAYGVPNHGKGSKANKGWFYGFKADVWAAYAVGVTYHDMYLKDGE